MAFQLVDVTISNIFFDCLYVNTFRCQSWVHEKRNWIRSPVGAWMKCISSAAFVADQSLLWQAFALLNGIDNEPSTSCYSHHVIMANYQKEAFCSSYGYRSTTTTDDDSRYRNWPSVCQSVCLSYAFRCTISVRHFLSQRISIVSSSFSFLCFDFELTRCGIHWSILRVWMHLIVAFDWNVAFGVVPLDKPFGSCWMPRTTFESRWLGVALLSNDIIHLHCIQWLKVNGQSTFEINCDKFGVPEKRFEFSFLFFIFFKLFAPLENFVWNQNDILWILKWEIPGTTFVNSKML